MARFGHFVHDLVSDETSSRIYESDLQILSNVCALFNMI